MRGWLAAAAFVGLVGCANTSGTTAETKATAPTSSTAAVTVTLPPTTTLVPAVPQPTPGDAANAAIGAWRAGDRDAALQVATVAAVDALFAIQAASVEARGCNQGGADPSYCVYKTDVGELQLRLTMANGGWIVAGAILGTG